jgi:hypothetical protein
MYSLWTLVVIFIIYVLSHISIGIWAKKIENDPTMPDWEKKVKFSKAMFKYWAMVYLGLTIIYLYLA